MQEICLYGSVRGASGNRRPYRDQFFLHAAVETLSRCAFVIPDRFMRGHGNDLSPAGILFDKEHMAKIPADLVDRPGIIGRIHQIIEVGHSGTAHLHQRYCNLTVVY